VHLVQLNVATLVAPQGDPRVAPFFDNLDRINRLGDSSPGFVWRLQDDSDAGGATDLKFFDDPLRIVNLTVWESVEALRAFTYRTEHVEFLRRRREFFLPAEGPHLVLWWVPDRHIPTVAEAMERLELLAAGGPSDKAFTFATVFPPA
jgi:hypothetical protein